MNNRFMPGPFVMIPSGAAKIMTVQEAHILQFVWALCLEGARGYPTGQRKGQTWVQVSTQQISDALGFWSLRTIKKYVDDLVASKLLLSASFKGTGRTNWMSPNYSEIERKIGPSGDGALGNPRTIPDGGHSAAPAPCIVQSSHHALGNPRTIDSAAPAPCIVQDLHSPLYRSLDPLDSLDVVDGARENSEPKPTRTPPPQKPLGDESPDSSVGAADEFNRIQAITDNVVWFDRMCAYLGQPMPPGNVAGIVAQVAGRLKDPKWLREYLLFRATELAGNENSRRFASFIIGDAAGWAPDESTREERVNGRVGKTKATEAVLRDPDERDISPLGFDWDKQENSRVIINDLGEIRPYWENQWRTHFYMRTAWEFEKIQKTHGEEQMRRAVRWMYDNGLGIDGEIRDPETFDPKKVNAEEIPDDGCPF